MINLKQQFVNGMLTVRYCAIQHLPFISTVKKFIILHEEENVSLRFLIETDYLNHQDEFYLMSSYVKKAARLNPPKARDVMNNKITLYQRCPELLGREYLILAKATEQEKLEFMKRHKRFVGKRNYGCFGLQFSAYDTDMMTMDEILKGIEENKQVLLEEYIVQHETVMKIYPNAVSSLRVHTVNNGKEVRCFLRPRLLVGCDGSTASTDNQGNGSYHLMLGTDGTIEMAVHMSASGKLKKAMSHHNTKVDFEQIKIPYVSESLALAQKAAGYFPEISYVGWDIAITPEGPVIIEGNAISGAVMTYQLMEKLYYGTGLKKEIDEMLDFGLNGMEQGKNSAAALVHHAENCLNLPTVYLWGGLGEILTKEVINDRKKRYPRVYSRGHCKELKKCIGRGIYGFDCSGLIKNFMMGGIFDYEYDPAKDMNSEMLLKAAEKSGKIDTIPELPGVCLYMPGHVGIYVGNGEVIESTSNPKFGNGVVKTKLSDREWTDWFFCPGVEYPTSQIDSESEI